MMGPIITLIETNHHAASLHYDKPKLFVQLENSAQIVLHLVFIFTFAFRRPTKMAGSNHRESYTSLVLADTMQALSHSSANAPLCWPAARFFLFQPSDLS